MADDDHISLNEAMQRLGRALDRLEASALRRADGARAAALSEEAMTLLRQDRAQLANDLDQALARIAHLEEACAGASKRVDHAIQSVRNVLSRSGRDAG